MSASVHVLARPEPEVVLGFTGTRSALTRVQAEELERQIVRLGPTRVVHGDCVGADAAFDAICKRRGIKRKARPCTFENLRAYCDAEEVAEIEAPMRRNRSIVQEATILIGCPYGYEPVRRGSGTWATIRFGERAGITVITIFPDGTRSELEGGT